MVYWFTVAYTAWLGNAQRLGDVYVCLFVEQEDEEANTGSHLKLIVDAFIQQLPNCVNRDLIDKVRTGSNSQLGKKEKKIRERERTGFLVRWLV